MVVVRVVVLGVERSDGKDEVGGSAEKENDVSFTIRCEGQAG